MLPHSTVSIPLANAQVDVIVPEIRPAITTNIDGGVASSTFTTTLDGGPSNFDINAATPFVDGGSA